MTQQRGYWNSHSLQTLVVRKEYLIFEQREETLRNASSGVPFLAIGRILKGKRYVTECNRQAVLTQFSILCPSERL